ncbi:MAG: alanine--tRNA ligase [Acidimicrobiales bacterium]
MDANALRRAFTQFFVDRGHVAVPSAGLIPHHPRAPLFTNAGMNQFIPYFLGEESPPYPRATSIQKCVRVRGKHDDIDLIGRTTRHLTFFEMLGNFSFGDYFKEMAIPLAWELLTEVLGLEADRLWVSVYRDDDEAVGIWRSSVGIAPERIVRMDEDNFWEMGDTGPCGPCSEIYFDRGPEWGEEGGPGVGGEERYVEVWNLVFMQFDRQRDGSLQPLPKPNIDTGAGLERILTLVEGVQTIWDTSVLRPVISAAEALTSRRYGTDEATDVSLRILADHARSVTFLVGDGVVPSNEDRGYVLRRLIRRAVRQAFALGVDKQVTPALVEACVGVMREAYPELVASQALITDIVAREEARFRATLRAGLAMLDAEISSGSSTIPGEVAFRLHDTHGFPIELTREIAAERGAIVDEDGFAKEMTRQRDQSRAGGKAPAGSDERLGEYRKLLAERGATLFVGYETTTATTTVTGVIPSGDDEAEIFLEATPFYAEGGGQVGDVGFIETDSGRAAVTDTTRALPDLYRHVARIVEGEIRPGQVATATIDAERRSAIRRNHTATHLLHSALRRVLGEHVKQQGSLVAPDRLRFDFTHYHPLGEAEIVQVEDIVNAQILSDGDVSVRVMAKVDADAAGAFAFFEDKYGDQVRVVAAGPASLELCGGTHVRRLGEIGPFKIVSEGSIGSNLRRVEAVTGTATLERMRQADREITACATLLRARPDEVIEALERRLGELRALQGRLEDMERSALDGRARELAGTAAGTTLVARVDGLNPDQLRELAAKVRNVAGLEVVVLGGSPDGSKAALAAVVAKGSARSAPELIGPPARTVGGGGGGRNPEHATAGGRDPSRLDEALDAVRSVLGA